MDDLKRLIVECWAIYIVVTSASVALAIYTDTLGAAIIAASLVISTSLIIGVAIKVSGDLLAARVAYGAWREYSKHKGVPNNAEVDRSSVNGHPDRLRWP